MQPQAPLNTQVIFHMEAAELLFFLNTEFSIKGLIIKYLLILLST